MTTTGKALLVTGIVVIASTLTYLIVKSKKNTQVVYVNQITDSNTEVKHYSNGFTLTNGVLKDASGEEIDTGVVSFDPVNKIITYENGATQDVSQF